MSFLDDPVAAAVALPPLVLVLFVFGSALLEYLFPPYWGDTFVLLGFFLAGQGAVAPAMVFAAAASGSLLGSIAAYQLGRRYGMAITHRLLRNRQRPSRRRLQSMFQRFGEKLLLVNRFLPVVRGVMLYGAGALRLPLRPVVVYCTLSNLAFISLLMWAGLWTADSWPGIQQAFRQSNRWLALIAVAAACLWLAAAWWRRNASRRRRAQQASRRRRAKHTSRQRRAQQQIGVSSGETTRGSRDNGSVTSSESDEGDRT